MEQNLFDAVRPSPCVLIEFRVLPSWNDMLAGVEAMTLRGEVKKWKKRGRTRALETLQKIHPEIKTETIEKITRSRDKRTGEFKREYFEGLSECYLNEPFACIVQMWRANHNEYDIHNLVIKPIFDGFVDIRLMAGDHFKFFPQMGFEFCGVDPSLKITAKEKEARDTFRLLYPKKPMPPLPAKIRFNFYRLNRLQNGSIYSVEAKI